MVQERERREGFLRGLGVALVTPFKGDGEVDYETLGRLVEGQLGNGADYIVALGTTAETPTLTEAEQGRIVRKVVEAVDGRAAVVVGVGGNNTRAVSERLSRGEWGGVDAILSVVPYYNKPSQEGIERHYEAVAGATSLPVILYNVPGRTGVNMTAATTVRIARACSNVVAVKEASGSMEQAHDIIRSKPEGFEVIAGDDAMAFPLIVLGARGVISVVGNALPREFGRMVHLALEGKYAEAYVIHLRMWKLFGLLFADGNPAGIKGLLHLQGAIENRLRLPLTPATEGTLEQMRAALEQLKELGGE